MNIQFAIYVDLYTRWLSLGEKPSLKSIVNIFDVTRERIWPEHVPENASYRVVALRKVSVRSSRDTRGRLPAKEKRKGESIRVDRVAC